MSTNLIPERGDIWLVNFDPTVGAEIKKIRPAAIVSANNLGIFLFFKKLRRREEQS